MNLLQRLIPAQGTRNAIAALGLIGLTAQPATAYQVMAPDAVVAGKSIADWTAAWWAWALQAPVATNPILDSNGAYANVNNNGPVYFVAGNTADRTFNVPAGKPILLPLINVTDTESIPPDVPGTPLTDRETAANLFVDAFMGAVNTGSLFASIDGSPVVNISNYQEVTGLFGFGPSQPGSLLDAIGVTAGTDTYPTKSGGYWLMIDGLSQGPHTLSFGGSAGDFLVDTPIGPLGLAAFSTETTDSIEVPEPATGLLLISAIAGMMAIRRRT